MVSGDKVRAVARGNFEAAKTSKPSDLAATRTSDEARRVEDNYEKALAAYLDTLIEGFEAKQGTWDELVTRAETAENELKEARQQQQSFAKRLTAMSKLTNAVAALVKAAKK